MSDPRLVLDLDGAEGGVQLLHQVVLFVVQRRPAQAGDAEGAPDTHAAGLPLPGLPPGPDDPLGDHVHGRVEVDLLPVRGVRRPVEDAVPAARAGGELQARRALRAQPAPADRRVEVALDVDDATVADVHVLAAADGAVGTDRLDHVVGGGDPRLQALRPARPGRPAEPEPVLRERLAEQRPGGEAAVHLVSSRHVGAPVMCGLVAGARSVPTAMVSETGMPYYLGLGGPDRMATCSACPTPCGAACSTSTVSSPTRPRSTMRRGRTCST